MKKTFLSIAILFTTLTFVSPTLAIDLGGGLAKEAAVKAGYDENTTDTTFAQTLGTVVKAVLSFVGIIFLSLTIYAGFLWMNAKGEEGEIDKAKEIIKAAIIGLIITVGAYSITAFVVPRVLERTAGGGPVADCAPGGRLAGTLACENE